MFNQSWKEQLMIVIMLSYFKYSVDLVYLRFSRKQWLHGQQLCKYTPNWPKIYGGGVLLKNKTTKTKINVIWYFAHS